MSKILVTGGAGFIGSHIVDELVAKGHEVVIIDDLSTGQKENIHPQGKLVELNIADPKVKEIFSQEKFDYVFHLAAQIDVRRSVAEPIFDAETNIIGGLNILENCKNFNIKKVIFSSTGGAIYGDTKIIPTPEEHREEPISPYGICKLALEKYLRFYYETFGLPYMILRYGNVYGPRQNAKGEAGVVAIFINKILAGEEPIINGDGEQTRDYVFVRDVARANLLALEKGGADIFNVGTEKATSVNQVFQLINSSFGNQIKEKHGEAKKGEQRTSCLSFGKIKNSLGWSPEMELEKGIKETVEWFRR